jgi:hypothetical protein
VYAVKPTAAKNEKSTNPTTEKKHTEHLSLVLAVQQPSKAVINPMKATKKKKTLNIDLK